MHYTLLIVELTAAAVRVGVLGFVRVAESEVGKPGFVGHESSSSRMRFTARLDDSI